MALRYGSPALRQLAAWPRGIVVDAVAGEADSRSAQPGAQQLPCPPLPGPRG